YAPAVSAGSHSIVRVAAATLVGKRTVETRVARPPSLSGPCCGQILGGGLAQEVQVVAPVVCRGEKGDELEVSGELSANVLGRVVGAAQARPGGAFVEDDELTVPKGRALRRRQAAEREVVLAEGRDQEVPPGLQHPEALADPRPLRLLGQMREHGERVEEVERRALEQQRRRALVARDLGERKVLTAPVDHSRVDVASVDPSSRKTSPLAENAPAAASEIQQSVELVHGGSVVAEDASAALGVTPSAP